MNQRSLRTTVHELGLAFAGTGPDLQRIIDTGTSFIHTANRNFDVTTALIRDGNTVLKGQVASSSAIRSFARDLRLFSGTLAGHDRDLRRVIDHGSVTATQLRTFLEDNRVDLADLINNLVTTGDIVVPAPARHPPDPGRLPLRRGGRLHRRLEVTRRPACTTRTSGWCSPTTRRCATRATRAPTPRPPQDGSNRPMNVRARCTEPASQSDARGAQHAPANRPAAAYRAPVAAYDPTTGRLAWGHRLQPTLTDPGSPAPATLGKESWRWLLLQPLTHRSR